MLDLIEKIKAISPGYQLWSGIIFTVIVVAIFIVLVDENIVENASQVTEKWSKLGILLTMFGTVFTLFKAIVLFSYKEAALTLLRVEQELSAAQFFANETSDQVKASQLKKQAVELAKQKEKLQSKPNIDIYDKWAIFFSIALLEIGLALQLFAT